MSDPSQASEDRIKVIDLASRLLRATGAGRLTPQLVLVSHRGALSEHRLEVLAEHLAADLGGIEIVAVEAEP